MNSYKLFLLLTLYLSTTNKIVNAQEWTGFKGCGSYKIFGVVRMKNNSPHILIHEKTQSEIDLSVAIKDEPQLAPFIGLSIEAQVELAQKMNGSKGTVKISSINQRIAHPLDPNDEKIEFLNKTNGSTSECK